MAPQQQARALSSAGSPRLPERTGRGAPAGRVSAVCSGVGHADRPLVLSVSVPFVGQRRWASSDAGDDVLRERAATIRELATAAGVSEDELPAGLPGTAVSDALQKEVAETVEEAVSTAEAVDAAEKSGMFSIFPQAVADGLTMMNAVYGVPYAYSVIGLTVAIRLMVFPFSLKMQQNAGRLALVQPQMNAIMEKMQRARNNNNHAEVKAASEEVKFLLKNANANPAKNLMFIVPQMMLFIPAFFGLRRLAETDPGLAAEAFLWVPSLAAPDPLFIMPALFGASMILTMMVGSDGMQASGKMKYVMYGMGVVVPFATYNFPSALHLFWTVGTGVAAFQTLGMKKIPGARKFFGIPTVPDHIAKANKKAAAKQLPNPLKKILEKTPLAKPDAPPAPVALDGTVIDVAAGESRRQRKPSRRGKRGSKKRGGSKQ
jgi:YidC/Oxa1 family membrane protein insertase